MHMTKSLGFTSVISQTIAGQSFYNKLGPCASETDCQGMRTTKQAMDVIKVGERLAKDLTKAFARRASVVNTNIDAQSQSVEKLVMGCISADTKMRLQHPVG